MKVLLLGLLLTALSLFVLAQGSQATSWSQWDTPAHNMNATAGPISYTPDCAQCGANCTGGGSCCGGIITESSGTESYKCRSNCLAHDHVCCGCNDPLPGQVADPNILCVSCPKSSQCFYKPSNNTNIRYFCASGANSGTYSALLALMMVVFALLLTNY